MVDFPAKIQRKFQNMGKKCLKYRLKIYPRRIAKLNTANSNPREIIAPRQNEYPTSPCRLRCATTTSVMCMCREQAMNLTLQVSNQSFQFVLCVFFQFSAKPYFYRFWLWGNPWKHSGFFFSDFRSWKILLLHFSRFFKNSKRRC